ncbi:MAG: TetR/AcrR family transcriptional regulator [Burkholderiales bacterium]
MPLATRPSSRREPARGRGQPAKKGSAKGSAPVPAADREPRGARRKRETRTRLLDAAFRLMAERGLDGVAINEITEAADVGFGSFYNHFESKEAIYEALIHAVFEEFGRWLDELVKDVDDPARAVAFCVRHTILRARREPLWGQFLVREGYSARVLSHGLGQFLLRDLKKGVTSGRFKAPDLLLTFLAVGGTVLTAIAAELQLGPEGSTPAALIKQLGMKTGDIPERTAAMLMMILGLSQKEAETIARLPLPGAPKG